MKLGPLEKIAAWVLWKWIRKQLRKDKKMLKLWNLLKGKKTHIVVVVALVLGILEGYEIYVIPEAGWTVLGALGLAALRAGVKDAADQLRKDNP